jgi:hypothetical protein
VFARLGRGAVVVAFDKPLLVVGPAEGTDSGARLVVGTKLAGVEPVGSEPAEDSPRCTKVVRRAHSGLGLQKGISHADKA